MQQHPLHPSKSYHSEGPPHHGEKVEPGGAEVGVGGVEWWRGASHRCEVLNTEVRNTRINTRITYYGIWKYKTLRIAIFDRVLLDTF